MGAHMARPSRTGGKTRKTKVRKARAAMARNRQAKRSPASTSIRSKPPTVSAPGSELQEAREQQAATADILKVIASSPSDVQPVFDAIVSSAASLFKSCTAAITTMKDGKLHWNAFATLRSDFDTSGAKAIYPIPFDPDRAPSARAILERRIIEISDTEAPDTPEFTRKASAAGGFRSVIFVPLVHRDTASAPSSFPTRNPASDSPKSSSPWSKPSPTRLSSQSRTRGCSMIYGSHCSNRPPPRTYSRSSAGQLLSSRPCSTRWWRPLCTSAAPIR